MKVGDTVRIGSDFIDAGRTGVITDTTGPWIFVEGYGTYHEDDLELVKAPTLKVGDKVRILDEWALNLNEVVEKGDVIEIVQVDLPYGYFFKVEGDHWILPNSPVGAWEIVEEPSQWDALEDTLEYEIPKTVLTPRGKKTEWVKRETAKKNDKKDGKVPLEYLRMDGISEMCEVFAFGANKYGKDNYLLGHHVDQLTAAALRHILAYQAGQELDPETGKSHVAHAQATLSMLQTQKTLGTLRRDDEA